MRCRALAKVKDPVIGPLGDEHWGLLVHPCNIKNLIDKTNVKYIIQLCAYTMIYYVYNMIQITMNICEHDMGCLNNCTFWTPYEFQGIAWFRPTELFQGDCKCTAGNPWFNLQSSDIYNAFGTFLAQRIAF